MANSTAMGRTEIMTSKAMSRRRFLGFSLAGAAVGTLASSSASHAALGLFSGREGERQVAAILKTYLQLGAEHSAVIREFTRSLTEVPAHTASPAASRAILAGAKGKQALEQYVLQEFIAGTNYRVWTRGKAPTLQWMTRRLPA